MGTPVYSYLVHIFMIFPLETGPWSQCCHDVPVGLIDVFIMFCSSHHTGGTLDRDIQHIFAALSLASPEMVQALLEPLFPAIIRDGDT